MFPPTRSTRLAQLLSRLTFANVVAVLALFVALGGSSYAALRVDSASIADDSIRSEDLRNNDVHGRDIPRTLSAAPTCATTTSKVATSATTPSRATTSKSRASARCRAPSTPRRSPASPPARFSAATGKCGPG